MAAISVARATGPHALPSRRDQREDDHARHGPAEPVRAEERGDARVQPRLAALGDAQGDALVKREEVLHVDRRDETRDGPEHDLHEPGLAHEVEERQPGRHRRHAAS